MTTFSAAEPGAHIQHLRPITVLPQCTETLLQQLHDVVARANRDNWDGMESLAANRKSVRQASRFLSMLPQSALQSIVPEITVDPDGEIAIEWYISPDQLFSVSIGANGRLGWAGIIDGEEVPGHAMLKQRIPHEVLNRINQLVAGTSHP